MPEIMVEDRDHRGSFRQILGEGRRGVGEKVSDVDGFGSSEGRGQCENRIGMTICLI